MKFLQVEDFWDSIYAYWKIERAIANSSDVAVYALSKNRTAVNAPINPPM